MRLENSVVLDTLHNNGGVFRSFGDSNQSSLLKKLRSAMLVSSLLFSVSVSASVLPNQMQEPTGQPIETTETVVNVNALDKTLINNYILISNLKKGNYENIDFSDVLLEQSEENDAKFGITSKDKRSMTSILKEVQKEHKINLEKPVFIEKLGINISSEDDEEALKSKLQASAKNRQNSSDVRVRAQTMIFIIANEGLSSKKGKDAQNHLTVGYGYDVDEQINSRVSSGMSKTQAKKIVYSELAEVGLNINQLIGSYTNKNHKIEITPAQAAILSANILDNYISYAKKSAGPKLWGLYKEGDIAPADLNRTAWTKSDFENKGGYFNNYMVLNNRMKSAYVYSVYNAGPRALGDKFKKQLEKGNIYSAIHSISVTWRDKNNQVIKNTRLMNNLALAFSSSYTMKTFVSNESDKYIQKEISQALSGESPDIAKMLKLQEAYNKNINQLYLLDVKKMKNNELSETEIKKYQTIKKQSDGLLVNINKYRSSFGDELIKEYSPEKNIINFEKTKLINDDVKNFNNQIEKFGENTLSSYEKQKLPKELTPSEKSKEKELIASNLQSDDFKKKLLRDEAKEFQLEGDIAQKNPAYIEKIKLLAKKSQEQEIKNLKAQGLRKKIIQDKKKAKRI